MMGEHKVLELKVSHVGFASPAVPGVLPAPLGGNPAVVAATEFSLERDCQMLVRAGREGIAVAHLQIVAHLLDCLFEGGALWLRLVEKGGPGDWT